MKSIITADNTETFLNEEVNETYHSQTGAVEEAFQKYAFPCKLKELAKTGKIRILDICSGMFYNSAAALDVALKENKNCQIEIIALEKDIEIIKKVKEVNPPIKNYKIIKEFIKNNSRLINENKIKENKNSLKNKKIKNITYNKNNIKLTLLMGDARKRIKELENDYFDAVFLDPFSPKTSPEMWQTNFFKEIFRVIKENKLLATYTCARIVRENMKQAGFSYDDGPIIGRRGPGTVGWKEGFF